ncbi:MAG TPA: phosphatidylinositol-specific phospholipase C domain-containing protein, partial [Candidatus Binataceae bacterium]|nr:phosphatidylinositol-specific phospholipase C domain-containing protein [Candidatus Binataceae bacterium]
VFQQLSFHDVLAACADFLKRNSTECIVMSVKEEFLPSSNTRDFEQTFDDYVAHDSGEWLLSGTIPTLREAMGKIVLLRRFAAETLPKGIDAADWPVNATFTIDSRFARLKIQDEYVVKDEKRKWDAVQRLYRDAFSAADECLYLNFTSGYRRGILGLPNITAVSDFINPELENYFKSNSTGRLGISVMDFADTERCALIIATNF